MAPRLTSLDATIRTFAHHGRANHPNSHDEPLDQALSARVSGWRVMCWIDAEGVPVVHPTGRVGGRLRKRRIRDVSALEFPDEIVRLNEILAASYPLRELYIDTTTPEAAIGVAELLSQSKPATPPLLWLANTNTEVLEQVRPNTPARLIHSATDADLARSPEQWLSSLRHCGVNGQGDFPIGGHWGSPRAVTGVPRVRSVEFPMCGHLVSWLVGQGHHSVSVKGVGESVAVAFGDDEVGVV